MRRFLVVLACLFSVTAFAQEAPLEPEIFEVVEEKPELIGGLASLQSRVVYPEAARRAGIEGKVFVQFVVDETGAVTEAYAVRCPHELLCEAGVKAVQESRFTPGRQKGLPVKVRFTLPIDFKLRDSDSVAPEAGVPVGERLPFTGPVPPSQGLPAFLGLQWSSELVAGGVGAPRSGTVTDGTGVLTYDDPAPEVDRVLLFVQDSLIVAMEAHARGPEAVAELTSIRELMTQTIGAPGEDGSFSPEQLGQPRRLFFLPESKTLRIQYEPLAGAREDTEIREIFVAPPPPADPAEEEIYEVVETRPELIGGLEVLQRRVVYPPEARRAGIQGRAFVQFITEVDGSVSSPFCVSGHPLLCQAAIDAVREATFTPGMMGGRPVRVRFTLPISFALR